MPCQVNQTSVLARGLPAQPSTHRIPCHPCLREVSHPGGNKRCHLNETDTASPKRGQSEGVQAPKLACLPRPPYLNSFSLFPRRSRTSQWELKASWGGIPQRMMAFRNALRCRALKPRTCRKQRYCWDHRVASAACGILEPHSCDRHCWTRINVPVIQHRGIQPTGSLGITALPMPWLRLRLTSMFPPTLASKGGRGLSLSVFSCLRDCLLPPRAKQPQ